MVENYILQRQTCSWKRFDKSCVRSIQDNSGFQQLGFQLQQNHTLCSEDTFHIHCLFNHKLEKSNKNKQFLLYYLHSGLWLSKCSIFLNRTPLCYQSFLQTTRFSLSPLFNLLYCGPRVWGEGGCWFELNLAGNKTMRSPSSCASPSDFAQHFFTALFHP